MCLGLRVGWGSLTSFYTQMMGTLNPLCPGCLVLVEGGGQANGWSNWGDGFTTVRPLSTTHSSKQLGAESDMTERHTGKLGCTCSSGVQSLALSLA